MTKSELLACAVRCDRLAEVCRDLLVAEKLRQLGRDYRELAGQSLFHQDFEGVAPIRRRVQTF
jgi:hypothetical protein